MSEGLLNYKIKIRKTLSAKQIRIHIAGSVTTRGLIRVHFMYNYVKLRIDNPLFITKNAIRSW